MKVKLVVLIAIVAAGFTAHGYYTHKIYKQLKSTEATLAQTTLTYEERIADLRKENTTIADELAMEKEKNENFSDQIGDIKDTVSDLEKLKRLDKELLQKYSKVYFLNEHYVPKKIEDIDPTYVLPGRTPQQFHASALPFLEEMFDDAKKDGIDLRVVSAYRSFNTQAIVKANHLTVYGSGANKFSADQGYSEHQLGTTMDLTTPKLGANFETIDKNPAFAWLVDHAHQYGFVLSYPKGNSYYIFEPWHWRFVGVSLAKKLHKEGKNFYDADQRMIDSYLIKIFD